MVRMTWRQGSMVTWCQSIETGDITGLHGNGETVIAVHGTLCIVQLQLTVSITVCPSSLLSTRRERTLQTPEILAPPGSTCILLQPLLLCSPVLEPDLDHPHVQTRVSRQLFSHVSGWLGTRLVSILENLHLAGGDGGARSLVTIHAVTIVCR